jgi:hypothetical protein
MFSTLIGFNPSTDNSCELRDKNKFFPFTVIGTSPTKPFAIVGISTS